MMQDLRISSRALRQSEQAMARLAKAEALGSYRDWAAERRARTRHLIELGGLVVVARLADQLEDDRAALLGALLMVGDLLDGVGNLWDGVGPEDLVGRWRERGRHALGPVGDDVAGDRRRQQDERQAATHRIIVFGGLVLKADLVTRVDDDRATLLGAFLALRHLLDDVGDDDLAQVSPADLKLRWRRRGLRAFDAEGGAKIQPEAATPPRKVRTAAE